MDVNEVAPDDVLAQRTRARLFALLAELRRPVGTAELADRLVLHPNGVRIHLERMEAAGLVRRARETRGRGRPRDAWVIAPGAEPGGRAPTGYHDLGRWLARALRVQPADLRSVERTGREIGRELAPGTTASGIDVLMASLTALGFQPEIAQSGDAGGASLCLNNCPYADAVHENQPVVCALHRGVTRGLLDVLLPDATLASFVPRDPDEAGCVVELTGVSDRRDGPDPPREDPVTEDPVTARGRRPRERRPAPSRSRGKLG